MFAIRHGPAVIKSAIFSKSSIVARAFSSQTDFESAQSRLKTLSEEPDSDVKLKLYGLFKQATSGDVQGSRPGMLDFVGRAKYDAWNSLKGKTKESAQTEYAKYVNELLAEDSKSNESESSQPGVEGLPKVNGLDITKEGKVFKITLNRPKKFNAITLEMYKGIQAALEASNKDKSTSVTVLTGSGDYYCAGNDLTNFKDAAGGSKEKIAQMASDAKVVLQDYVNGFINHEKPLIGLVNGPAVGISVTTLGLFDYVIATEKATFHTPFAPLGQSPEGASSYTFPLIMGPARAAELLLVCKKINASTAREYGLINEVVSDKDFQEHCEKTVKGFSELPPESLRVNKTLMRSVHKKQLLETTAIECETIAQRWQSKECHQAIAAFLTRPSK